MPTSEEIMLTFFGRDNVSNVTKSIDGNIRSMSSNAMSAVNNMSAGFMNIGSSFESMLTGLTGGKTASDLIFGTSSKAETNKVLLSNMTETAESAEALYKTVDEVTNKSLTSMQELIPAMNAFKAATGASDSELNNVTGDIANFGAAVLAQTGSTERAQTAMMDLSKGIKGAFASLDQYGVSEDALMRTGLWTGKEDDVEGYMAAVSEVIGSTEALMQTNEGLDAQIGKAFSRAGKKIGNEFLPGIKDLKKGFLDLDNSFGGNLSAGILVTAESVGFLNQGLFQVTTMANGIRDLQAAFGGVRDVLKGVVARLTEVKGMQTAIETIPDVTSQQIMDAEAKGGFQVESPKKNVNKKDYLDDMLKYQVASVEDDKITMGLLEHKYKDLDLEANKLDATSTRTFDNLDKTVNNTSKTKKIGSKAGKASSGMKSTATSLRGLGSGALSMVAPLIQLGIAIAIIMPIVAVLAAEALLLIKGIGELIKALDFKSMNLNEQIEGIKQIGSAMWELSRTMGAMSLAGATTMVYTFISGFIAFQNPIQIAIDHLKSAVRIVNQLSEVAGVNKDIPGKLKNLTVSLQSVSTTMDEMGSVTRTVIMGGLSTLGGLLGSYTDNLRVAKTELTNAVNILNEFGSLGSVDEGVVNKLKAVTDALSSASTAMGKIGDVNWAVGMTNLNPFSDVTSALQQTKEDIIDASKVLNTFTGIQDIPQDVGNKLQKVASALESANKALQSLSKIDSEVNLKGGNPFKNVVASLKVAKSDIINAAKILNGFTALPDLPDEIKSKLNRVGSVTATAINTLKPLSQLSSKDINAGEITGKVQQARYAISNAATHLSSLTGIAQVPENLSEILNKVGTAAATVINTLKPLTQLANLEVNSSEISAKVQQARYTISNTASHLASLGGIASIPENLGENLNRVGIVATQVSNVTSKLNMIPAPTSTGNIGLSVSAIKTTVTELNKLTGTSLNGGISGLLNTVTSTLNQLKATITAMGGGFYASGVVIGSNITNGVNVGLMPLSSVVISAINSATSNAAGTGRTGGATIGTSVTNGFKSTLKLANVMKTEMAYVKQAVSKGIESAKLVAKDGAEKIVEAFKSGIEVGSPGAMAWAMFDEMGYIKDFIQSEGKNVVNSAGKLGQDIVKGFGKPTLSLNPLSQLDGNGKFITEYLGSIKTMVSPVSSSSENRPIILHIYEGAVQLDARNFTTNEARQLILNAIEGF